MSRWTREAVRQFLPTSPWGTGRGAAAEVPPAERHTGREILLFWAPLAATWTMMALEGPFLAAVIARLAEAKFNLAAHGVAFAFAILVEAPVIMLMSASTALVEDASSYRRLRRFTWALNAAATGLLVAVLAPPVYGLITGTLLNLPEPVADLTYGALWILLPWPAAIGYRRFLQGLLIRAGRTRLVAYGTALRVAAMAATALLLYFAGSLPGAWVGACSLSVGVLTEAAAARLMARETVSELRATPGPRAGGASEADREARLEYREILRFYYPLALTSFIALTVQPLLTFFMGRAPAPVESLAVFPVVNGLAFLFRAPGLGYQEVAIALLGDRCEHWPEVSRFAAWAGLAASGVLALVTFTPLADVWFVTVSGLTEQLADVALTPARILAPLPALTFLLAFQRAVQVQNRETRPVTVASAVEVVGIALLFSLFGWGIGMVGVTAAALAFAGGRLAGNLTLLKPVSEGLRAGPASS